MAPARRHRPATGRAGTTSSYDKGCRCPDCTQANTEKARRRRERAKERGSRPILSIVDGTPTEVHEPPAAAKRGYTRKPALGLMEKAVTDDLASLSPTDVPGFNTYKGAALTIAKELDNTDSRASKAPLVKQLVDVMSKLTGKESGDGNSLEDLLAGLAQPLPGTEDWNPT